MDIKVINLRGTIFIDGIIPFSIPNADKMISILAVKNSAPIILQNFSIGSNQMATDWGVIGPNNQPFAEIHNNRIDLFGANTDEKEFLDKLNSIISSLIPEFNLRIKRLAFAPTYQISFTEGDNIFSRILISSDLLKTELKDFSLNRVYTRTENIEGISYIINYNSSLVLQSLPLGMNNNKKILLVANDINTKSDVLKIYSEKEVNVFFANVVKLNKTLFNLAIGE